MSVFSPFWMNSIVIPRTLKHHPNATDDVRSEEVLCPQKGCKKQKIFATTGKNRTTKMTNKSNNQKQPQETLILISLKGWWILVFATRNQTQERHSVGRLKRRWVFLAALVTFCYLHYILPVLACWGSRRWEQPLANFLEVLENSKSALIGRNQVISQPDCSPYCCLIVSSGLPYKGSFVKTRPCRCLGCS